VLFIAIVGLAIWYFDHPEPLLVQGEAESTRIDIAARADPISGDAMLQPEMSVWLKPRGECALTPTRARPTRPISTTGPSALSCMWRSARPPRLFGEEIKLRMCC
jgi:hypothetical protein